MRFPIVSEGDIGLAPNATFNDAEQGTEIVGPQTEKPSGVTGVFEPNRVPGGGLFLVAYFQ